MKVAEKARKLGVLVMADEVYEHLTFGSNPFITMGVFGSTVPVIILGSISKKWAVPGWRGSWLVTSDPDGTLKHTGIAEQIKACLNIGSDPVTFIQVVLFHFMGLFLKFLRKLTRINMLKHTSDILCDRSKEIPCITCPKKPEGSVFIMVKLDLSLLEGIDDDMDFCVKLAKEESVIILPGEK
ncbi:hypothetical protein CRYUN_Cryun18bG0054000 [Craigia yunnanensis]